MVHHSEKQTHTLRNINGHKTEKMWKMGDIIIVISSAWLVWLGLWNQGCYDNLNKDLRKYKNVNKFWWKTSSKMTTCKTKMEWENDIKMCLRESSLRCNLLRTKPNGKLQHYHHVSGWADYAQFKQWFLDYVHQPMFKKHNVWRLTLPSSSGVGSGNNTLLGPKEQAGPGNEITCSIGANRMHVPTAHTWRRRQSRPSKYCVFLNNIGWQTQSKNHSGCIIRTL
jgi:hypothetical protein